MTKEMRTGDIRLPNPELVRNVVALKQEFDEMLMFSSAFNKALARAYLSTDIVEAAPKRNCNVTFPLKGCRVSNMIVDCGWILGISIEAISESQLKKPLDMLGYEFGSEKISLRFQESGNYPNYITAGEIIHSRISVNGRRREVHKNTQTALEKTKQFATNLHRRLNFDNKFGK